MRARACVIKRVENDQLQKSFFLLLFWRNKFGPLKREDAIILAARLPQK